MLLFISLLVTVLGYVVIYLTPTLQQYILSSAFVLLFVYIFYIIFPRFKVLDFKGKIYSIISSFVFAAVLLGAVAYVISQSYLPIYFYPPIFGLLVPLSRIFKFFVNSKIKEPKSYGVSSETIRGEIVRSKGEKKVADWFYEHKYEYIYEQKVEFPDGQSLLYDFYMPDQDIYVEYWGLSGANNATGEKYRARKKEKMELYEAYDLKLMSIYPQDLYELDTVIPKQIKQLLSKRKGFFAWLFAFIFGRKSKSKQIKQISVNHQVVEGSIAANLITKESSDKTKESAKIFCTNCGEELPGENVFCTNCGTQN